MTTLHRSTLQASLGKLKSAFEAQRVTLSKFGFYTPVAHAVALKILALQASTQIYRG